MGGVGRGMMLGGGEGGGNARHILTIREASYVTDCKYFLARATSL